MTQRHPSARSQDVRASSYILVYAKQPPLLHSYYKPTYAASINAATADEVLHGQSVIFRSVRDRDLVLGSIHGAQHALRGMQEAKEVRLTLLQRTVHAAKGAKEAKEAREAKEAALATRTAPKENAGHEEAKPAEMTKPAATDATRVANDDEAALATLPTASNRDSADAGNGGGASAGSSRIESTAASNAAPTRDPMQALEAAGLANGVVGWYDSTQYVGENGLPIDVWTDLSGCERHLVRRDSVQPRYVSYGINGKPSASFGKGDVLVASSGTRTRLRLSHPGLHTSAGSTLVATARIPAAH